jgi:hypothetical protein
MSFAKLVYTDACVYVELVVPRRTSEFPSWTPAIYCTSIMEEDTIETNVGMVDVEENRILLHHDH